MTFTEIQWLMTSIFIFFHVNCNYVELLIVQCIIWNVFTISLVFALKHGIKSLVLIHLLQVYKHTVFVTPCHT